MRKPKRSSQLAVVWPYKDGRKSGALFLEPAIWPQRRRGWRAIRAGHCSARRQVGRRGVLPVIPELDVVLELVPGLLDGTHVTEDRAGARLIGTPSATANTGAKRPLPSTTGVIWA